MDRETSLVPLSEGPSEARQPLHLRYFGLLRRNPRFRRLWLAQLVSELGDWFYSLAVYDLLLSLTHSGKAVAWSIIIQTLPWFLMTPLAGPIADRFSRRKLMIAADIVRGFVVLSLLLVHTRADVWLVYALLLVEVVFASIFEPARNALLPNVVSDEDLLAANALSSATWSLALAVGGALGGAVTLLFGRPVAFVVNSISFFVSAILIQAIRVRETHLEANQPSEEGRQATDSLRQGAAYLGKNPKIIILVLAKLGLGSMGGMLALLAVFGEQVFPIFGKGALATGLLYAARGVGAGIGPLLGERWTRERQSSMWTAIGIGFLVMSAAYFAFSRAPSIALALLAIFIAHLGSSNVWVMSTTLLQLNVEDRFRGRVFALDFGALMLMITVSNFLIGKGLDDWHYSPRQLVAALSALALVPALLWFLARAKWGNATE